LNNNPVSPWRNQLAVSADVGSGHEPALRHCAQRAERGDQLGEAHRDARIHHHVDQIVVTLHLVAGDVARESDLRFDSQCVSQPFELWLVGPAACKQTRACGTAAVIAGSARSSRSKPS
jgi:hypothetical protein